MREELAAMGHLPGDDEFYAIILGSLPSFYEPFISALNTTSSVVGTVLSPDELMQAFTDEYDCQNLGKSTKKDDNVAFSAAEGSSKKKPKGKKKGNCHNCGKPGHYKADCWEEGGGKEGQKPKRKGKEEKKEGEPKDKEKSKGKDSAASAKTDHDDDAAWMALSLTESEDDNSNPTTPFSSTSLSFEDLLEVDKELQKEIGKAAFTTTFDSAALAKSSTSPINIELFDSGASRHMSGYRHRFINFVEIEPKPITAADKHTFNATGKGDKSQTAVVTQKSSFVMFCIAQLWE